MALDLPLLYYPCDNLPVWRLGEHQVLVLDLPVDFLPVHRKVTLLLCALVSRLGHNEALQREGAHEEFVVLLKQL